MCATITVATAISVPAKVLSKKKMRIKQKFRKRKRMAMAVKHRDQRMIILILYHDTCTSNYILLITIGTPSLRRIRRAKRKMKNKQKPNGEAIELKEADLSPTVADGKAESHTHRAKFSMYDVHNCTVVINHVDYLV